MAYQHGVRIIERETSVVAPITGTAGLQVVIGTAPVNLTDHPAAAVNTPIVCNTFAEASARLGYSDDWVNYTLCQSMYASFIQFAVAPVVFINVLDPAVHRQAHPAQRVTFADRRGCLPVPGVLRDSVVVSYEQLTEGEVSETVVLQPGTDYELNFDDSGYLVIDLLADLAISTFDVSCTSIDPGAVTASDIIGASSSGGETGLAVVRQVLPKLSLTPGLLLAPGWSQIPDVGTALAAACENINGYYSCECLVDIDSNSVSGCSYYTDVKAVKDAAGATSTRAMDIWPCIAYGSRKFYGSAIWGALTAYVDASNDDVPSLSPSNALMGATATVLSDAVYDSETGWDKEVVLDQLQGNSLNGFGVATAINVDGFRTWGNNTAAYPAVTDPRDRWFCCRRFFSWWGNTFIRTYFSRVDDPLNLRLVESIVDSENIRGNAYVAQGKCAEARIEYVEAENPITDVLNGKLTFHQHLTPYPPAEDIVNVLEFDPSALTAELTGG